MLLDMGSAHSTGSKVHVIEHLDKTFKLQKLPFNVRLGLTLQRIPFARRFGRFAMSRIMGAKGTFAYSNGGASHLVEFNGRNLQFSALYDPHYQHGYELETASLIYALCQGNSPFFDVGANWGYFSLLVASLPNFHGQISAFEPNPRTFCDLTRTISEAGQSDRVKGFNVGVGQTATELRLEEVDPYLTGLAHLSAQGTGRKIAVVPIDEVASDPPGFIKIDAEGMELEILKGAARSLERAKPFVVFESFLDYARPASTLGPIDYLSSLGYRQFVPYSTFAFDGYSVPTGYGHDVRELMTRDCRPQLGVMEFSSATRFMLNNQINILGVHNSRVHDLWDAGIANLGTMHRT